MTDVGRYGRQMGLGGRRGAAERAAGGGGRFAISVREIVWYRLDLEYTFCCLPKHARDAR